MQIHVPSDTAEETEVNMCSYIELDAGISSCADALEVEDRSGRKRLSLCKVELIRECLGWYNSPFSTECLSSLSKRKHIRSETSLMKCSEGCMLHGRFRDRMVSFLRSTFTGTFVAST